MVHSLLTLVQNYIFSFVKFLALIRDCKIKRGEGALKVIDINKEAFESKLS